MLKVRKRSALPYTFQEPFALMFLRACLVREAEDNAIAGRANLSGASPVFPGLFPLDSPQTFEDLGQNALSRSVATSLRLTPKPFEKAHYISTLHEQAVGSCK